MNIFGFLTKKSVIPISSQNNQTSDQHVTEIPPDYTVQTSIPYHTRDVSPIVPNQTPLYMNMQQQNQNTSDSVHTNMPYLHLDTAH